MQPSGGNGSLGQAVKDVSDHAVALAKLEAKLARQEMSQKGRRFAPAAVLGVVAVVLVLFGFGFGLAAAVEGLGSVVPRWAALLIVAGVLVVAAVLAGLVARETVKNASSPVPEQAIEEAKRTTRAVRSAGAG
jgi:protein-S-isoprenylcysteine O-methyltransferase Ste14